MSSDEGWETSGLVGKQVAGHYLISRERAADRACKRYDAQHVERGIRVLLAVIRAGGPAPDQRLRNVEKLKSLGQPALVDVLEAGRINTGELFVATELPEGKNLRDVIAEQPLEQRRALLIIRQVLQALTAVHATGEIHGDVKPENLVILPGLGPERIKLGGLGIATLAGAGKTGDPVYYAPESAVGAPDARADLYAVGGVLFELLTGRPPFHANDADGFRRLHAYAPVQTLAQRVPQATFSDAVEAVVATALAKKRDARFRTAADMIDAVDRALGGLQEPAAPAVPKLEAPDESLQLLAKDLIRPVPAAPDVPSFSENVEREVPTVPWLSRVRAMITRQVDQLSARFGIAPKKIFAGLAIVGVILLVVVIGMCARSDDSKAKDTTVATAPEPPQPEPTQPIAPKQPTEPKQPVVKPEPAITPADLERRCERLGKACGDGAKHVTTLTAECKQAAKSQTQSSCARAAITAYDCYETKLCGRKDKVWALDDLRVLSERKAKCAAEANAVRACTGI